MYANNTRMKLFIPTGAAQDIKKTLWLKSDS